MHEVKLRMSDNAFHYLNGIINYMDDVSIVEDTKQDDDKVDIKHCLDTLADIKAGNLEDFEAITDIDKHIHNLKNEIS